MTSRDRDGHVGRSCYVCDDDQTDRRHPASYLTDLNNPSNVTCWISQPIVGTGVSAAAAAAAAATVASDEEDDNDVTSSALIKSDNVTLTLRLGKKFEVEILLMPYFLFLLFSY